MFGQLSQKFDEIMTNTLNFDNKYVMAAISLSLIMYAGMAAPKLPTFVVNLFDNVLVKILFMFLVLFINYKYPPTVSLIVAVCVAGLFMAFDAMKKTNETMALVTGGEMDGVPQYVYSMCGDRICSGDDKQSRGEHGEIIDSDGPIVGISDADADSLCMHIENKNIDVNTDPNFSELVNAKQSCAFSKHQYNVDLHDVKCADPSSITGNDSPFPLLAPTK